MIAKTPNPPYYAVICTSLRTKSDQGYRKMSSKILEIAKNQPGFLGFESASNELGISVSYWKDMESIKIWSQNKEHALAKNLGKEKWYEDYRVRICKVEQEY